MPRNQDTPPSRPKRKSKAKPKPKAEPKPNPKTDEDDDDRIVVICFKVLLMPRAPVAGCSKKPCTDCGQSVWISPATMAHVADKPHRICCAECVAKQADDDLEVIAPTEAQMAEIASNDPTISIAKIRRAFPASNPKKRRATLEELLRRTRSKKRTDN